MENIADLKLPEEADSSTAKVESVQLADRTVTTMTFSCGLVIEYDLSAKEARVRTNWKVVLLPDGQYAIEKP